MRIIKIYILYYILMIFVIIIFVYIYIYFVCRMTLHQKSHLRTNLEAMNVQSYSWKNREPKLNPGRDAGKGLSQEPGSEPVKLVGDVPFLWVKVFLFTSF